jgi:O-palmitoleoyl-L-serine hydrolase
MPVPSQSKIRYFMIQLLLVGLLVSQTIAASTFKLTHVEDADALCLDGSKAAYYAVEGDPKKFIISFEGGGWCGSYAANINLTIDNCHSRSKTAMGSSTTYAPTMVLSQGILSDNELNPFRSWTKVHLKYCDGTGHQGYRKDPVVWNG